jgi:uncharacterized phage protein (TIGR01671 family)
MREIRFRAWDIKEKKMWEVASLWGSGSKWELEPQRYGAKITSRLGDYEIRSCELMQYTGLKDKNGKEIYEGDIVIYKYVEHHGCEEQEITTTRKGVIKFLLGQFMPIPTSEVCEDGYYSWMMYDFEVIGNIYDNPELLKEEK